MRLNSREFGEIRATHRGKGSVLDGEAVGASAETNAGPLSAVLYTKRFRCPA